jgi:hypothetical protein
MGFMSEELEAPTEEASDEGFMEAPMNEEEEPMGAMI